MAVAGNCNASRSLDELPHIALLIETSREYARGLLRGIARYHQEFGPWSIFLETRGLAAPAPHWLANWDGDGILARVNDTKMADAILATGLPAVDLRGALSNVGLPFIGIDNLPVAQMAFEHLTNCGLTRFAFCGTPDGENPNQDLRRDHFVAIVEAAGFQCDVCLGAGKPGKKIEWEKEQQYFAKWVKSLPKPVGLMTCHDDRGQQILDACRRAQVIVPDDIAVISVDNDVHLCNLATPTLTSIDVNPGRIGYQGAAILDEMMRGKTPTESQILIGPPRGIAARRSTDTISIDDQEVAHAIRFIRENAVKGIRVSAVHARSGLSVSMLERRVKKTLGRSIKAEINRVRMLRAKLLLSETDLTISDIARRTGFAETKYFCEVFRKIEGMTATQFRKPFQGNSWNDGGL